MFAKGLLLVGLGAFIYLGLLSTPRVLERGVASYLKQTFPEAKVAVHISAGPFWFLSGNLDRVSVRMSHFDASQFPLPTTGVGTASSRSQSDHNGSASAERAPVAGPAIFNAPSPGFQDEAAGETLSPSGVARFLSDEGASVVGDVLSGSGETGLGARRTLIGEAAFTGLGGTPPTEHHVQWARIGRVDLLFRDFKFYGRHVSDFQAKIPDVHYDFRLARSKRMLRLGQSGSGVLQIGLSPGDLDQAITIDRPEIRNVQIHPEAGHLRISLDYRTPLGWAPVTVTGRIAVQNGKTLWFTDPAISALNISFPAALTEAILSRVQNLNPVFDLDTLELPMEVRITSVESSPGTLTLRSLVQIPG